MDNHTFMVSESTNLRSVVKYGMTLCVDIDETYNNSFDPQESKYAVAVYEDEYYELEATQINLEKGYTRLIYGSAMMEYEFYVDDFVELYKIINDPEFSATSQHYKEVIEYTQG